MRNRLQRASSSYLLQTSHFPEIQMLEHIILLTTFQETNFAVLYTYLYAPCVLSHFGCTRLYATLWTTASQAPLSAEFSRPAYWSGLLCLPSGDLPNPGIKPMSLKSTCIGRWVLNYCCHLGSPHIYIDLCKYKYIFKSVRILLRAQVKFKVNIGIKHEIVKQLNLFDLYSALLLYKEKNCFHL